MSTSNPQPSPSIFPAFQLGWLAVESFGLLRRYARHGKPSAAAQDDATRRFGFTARQPNLSEQLLVSLQHLKATAAGLVPGLPPPVPDEPEAWVGVLKDDKAATSLTSDRYEYIRNLQRGMSLPQNWLLPETKATELPPIDATKGKPLGTP